MVKMALRRWRIEKMGAQFNFWTLLKVDLGTFLCAQFNFWVGAKIELGTKKLLKIRCPNQHDSNCDILISTFAPSATYVDALVECISQQFLVNQEPRMTIWGILIDCKLLAPAFQPTRQQMSHEEHKSIWMIQ